VSLLTVTVHCVGKEGEPVVVIDNFAAQPDVLRDEAVGRSFTAGDNHYPGVKAPVADDYLQEQRAVLGKVFREVFGIAHKVSVLEVGYALVATAPGALTLEQRLPHVDALEPGRLALVHYLVPGRSDGTAFFCHRSTGYETIDRARSAVYFARLNKDLRRLGTPPPAYLDGSTEIFERIAHFEGVYNRAIVYRSKLLHSGAIKDNRALSADPLTGRLTITGFFSTG
jgi:Family of unknown function (DUF6445)